MFKRRIRVLIIITIYFNLTNDILGQEHTHFSQFFFNPSTLNPSLTGIDGQSAAFLSYRRQWVGIEGSPVTGQFSVQAPSPGRLSIGLNVNQDKRGVISTSSVLLSTAYNIPINKDVFFRFGFSLGAGFFRTDLNALRFGANAADPVVGTLAGNDIQFLGNTGLSLHAKSFHLGVAVPTLFRQDYLATEPFSVGTFKPMDQLIIHGSYRYYLQKGKYLFEPFINYRYNQNSPSQLEVAGLFHLQNLVWLGASYKQDFGISGMVGYKVSSAMAVGYSYSIRNTGLNQLASPSHEVQLGMLFGTRHKNIPVYSFVNTEKPKLKGRPANMVAQKKKPAPVPPSKGTAVAKAGFQPKTATPPKTQEKPVKQDVAVSSSPGPAKTAPAVTLPQKDPVVASQTSAVKTQVKEVVSGNRPVADQVKQPESKPVGVITPQKDAGQQVADNNPAVKTQTSQSVSRPDNVAPVQKESVEQVTATKPKTEVPETVTPVKTADPGAAGSTRLKEQKVDFSTPDPRDRPDNNQAGTPRLKEKSGTPIQAGAVDEDDDEEGEDADLLHGTSHLADSLQEVDERERFSRLEVLKVDPLEANKDAAPHLERYERVKRGMHKEEMDLGDYVIIGVFKSEANAKKWADGVKALGFLDVDYGYLTNKLIWYVHFEGTDNLDEAKATREKYRRIKLFRDAWLLTVHP